MKQYDLIIEDFPSQPEDARLVSMRFPAMRSQLDNQADLINLKVKPTNMKFKLEVEHNKYSSTTDKVEDDRLYACQIVQNKLICRPISYLVTMRADLSHLDQKEGIEKGVKDEAQPVTVKYSHADRQSKYPTRASAAEPEDLASDFEDVRYKSVNSRDANSQRVSLFGARNVKMEVDLDPNFKEEKMDTKPIPIIIPKTEKMDIEDIYSGANQSSSSRKQSTAVKQLVEECLIKAKLVSFEEVYRFVDDKNDSNNSVQFNNRDIIAALTEFAVMVQGNWAVKSEVLYGSSVQKECTDVTGIPISIFIAARDYLLWLFNQDRLVTRLDYSRKVRLPDYDVLVLFNQLATFRDDLKKWELKLPTDERFIAQYPEVVQRQANFWKVRRANKLSLFK